MKKIKLLSLITLILTLCTGCSIEYNITIDQDNIEEIINIADNITVDRTKNDILTHYNMWYPTYVNFISDGETIEVENFNEKVEGIEYHQKEIKETPDGYNYSYKYKHNINRYYDSYSLATAFIETTAYNGYDSLVLKTSKENLLCQYDYFNTLKVNITIDPKAYKLNYTNTENITNNTYTWILDKDNCNNSEIVLTLDKLSLSNKEPNTQSDNNKNEQPKQEKKKTDLPLYIFYGVMIILVLIAYIIIKKIKNKGDKFDI